MKALTAWLRGNFQSKWAVYSDGSYDKKTVCPNEDPLLLLNVSGYSKFENGVYSISTGETLRVEVSVTDPNDRHVFPDSLGVTWFLTRVLDSLYDPDFPYFGYQNNNQLVFEISATNLAPGYLYELYALAADVECGCTQEVIKIQRIEPSCLSDWDVSVVPCADNLSVNDDLLT